MNWIILKENTNIVDNVIVADEDFINQHYPNAIHIEDDVCVMEGDSYENGIVTRVYPTPVTE
jgi:hypothetical protein